MRWSVDSDSLVVPSVKPKLAKEEQLPNARLPHPNSGDVLQGKYTYKLTECIDMYIPDTVLREHKGFQLNVF